MSSFDDKARDWDTPERQERAVALARVIGERVTLSPTMRVIDVGAGTGLLGIALAGAVDEVVLAEPSGGMLEVAREKLASGAWPNVGALAFDLMTDPPPGPPFDLAVSLLVLHHVPDTGAALAALRDLLAPGGRICIADLDAEDGSFHEQPSPDIHHQGFDRVELVRLAGTVGLVDADATDALEIERDGRRYPLFLLTATRA